MTKDQRSRLAEYLDDESIQILSIEYPAGISVHDKASLNNIKVCYNMIIPERGEKRGYVDWYGEDGWSTATEYKGVVNDSTPA